MQRNIKNRKELEAQIADYIARGGKIQKEDPQTATKALLKAMSMASRHLGKHNKMGARV
jgi:hypothetical protein